VRDQAERLWPISAERPIVGKGGPLKAFLRRFMRWYVEPAFADQRAFNDAVLKLIDAAIADRHWFVALGWGAGVAVASWSSLLAEMSALQTWPATRSIPVVFGIEMVLPAALLPLLTHVRPGHVAAFAASLAVACAGAAILGSSRAVARAAAPLTEP
jgi:hypothetical protein